MFQAGETSADGFQGYMENITISGVYAQEFGGAGVILERESFLIAFASHANWTPKTVSGAIPLPSLP